MAEESENIPKLVFCRKCGEHTPHIIHMPVFEEKIDRKSSKINQIIFCDKCGTAILEVFIQYLDEAKTQSIPERFPNIAENFKQKIENNTGTIESDIFQSYSDCVDSYNLKLYRASFVYLITSVDLVSNFLLKKDGSHNTDGKTLKYKLSLLKTKSRKNKRVEKFSTFFSTVLTNYSKCVESSFNPIISEIETGIDALTLILHYEFRLNKMNDMALEELDSIYQKHPQNENIRR